MLIADIDMEAAEANVKTIRSTGNTTEAFRADVEKHDYIKAMVSRAVELWDKLDILINNALLICTTPMTGTPAPPICRCCDSGGSPSYFIRSGGRSWQ